MTNNVRLWLYPGASPNSTPTSWEPFYVDITQYVRRPGSDGGAPINYSWGKQDESTQTDASQMTLTLDNRDGRFSTDKIDGPYYGALDINTPIRLGVLVVTDTFTRTVASGWGTVQTAPTTISWDPGVSTATYSANGSRGEVILPTANSGYIISLVGANTRDVDIVSTITPLAMATGASYGQGHYVRRTDNNNLSYSTLEFDTAGTVTIKIRTVVAGVVTTIASSNPVPGSSYTANVAWKLHTQVDGDTIRVKAWPLANTEPTSWMISADEPNNAGTGIGIYNVRFVGNTNTGVAALMATDDFTVMGLEWTGYVVSWPLRWDITARNSWAPITAGGVLRRLRQGTNPVQSPLRHQLGATADASGYWPLEEGSDAKYFLGTTADLPVASMSGVTPATDTSLPGGGPAPTITTAGGSIKANVRRGNAGSGMAAMVLFKLPSLPAAKTRIVRVRMSRGVATVYDFSVDNTGTTVEAFDAQLNLLSSASNAFGVDFDNKWIAWELNTDNTGGNTAWEGVYHSVGELDYFVQSGSHASGINTVVSGMELYGAVGTAFAHIWMGANTLPFASYTFSLVSSGYEGEFAIDRFKRVASEAGLQYAIGGPDGIASEAMGPQKESNTLAILQSCVDADYGVMTERGAGVEFIPRAARWNLTQTVALSVAAGHIADVPQPTRDDQKLRNTWTVSRVNGGSQTSQDDASVARNGTWDDSATLNVLDDSVLLNHAGWRVAIGVQTRLRWPSLPLNFARSPSLMSAWRQRFYGWRLGVTTGLTQVTGNEPDVIMEGYQASLTPEVWEVDMNCTDGRVWNAGVTDDTGIYGRADNEYCTTTSSITASALSIPVTTAVINSVNMPKWDNTAGLWSGGVDLNVGGERVTATVCTNGAGQAQTFTITARGVNGYAVAHASGTSVSLWNPPTVAL
jgi:hypothetical protein